jgi:hypothetical protein
VTYDTACEVAGRPRQTARGGVDRNPAHQAFILLAMPQRLASLWLSPGMSSMLGTMYCCGEMQGNNGLSLILPPTSYHSAHASRRKNNAEHPMASSSDVSSRIVTARENGSMVRPSSDVMFRDDPTCAMLTSLDRAMKRPDMVQHQPQPPTSTCAPSMASQLPSPGINQVCRGKR